MDKAGDILVLDWGDWLKVQELDDLTAPAVVAVGLLTGLVLLIMSCCQTKINKNIPEHIKKEMQVCYVKSFVDMTIILKSFLN